MWTKKDVISCFCRLDSDDFRLIVQLSIKVQCYLVQYSWKRRNDSYNYNLQRNCFDGGKIKRQTKILFCCITSKNGYGRMLTLFHSLVVTGTETVTEPGQSSKAALSRVERTLKPSLSGSLCVLSTSQSAVINSSVIWSACLIHRFTCLQAFTFALAWYGAPFSSTVRFQVINKRHHSLRSIYVNILLRFTSAWLKLNTFWVWLARAQIYTLSGWHKNMALRSEWGAKKVFSVTELRQRLWQDFFLRVRPCVAPRSLVPAKARSHFKHIKLNMQRLPTAIRWNIWKSFKPKWKTVR